MYVVCRKIVKKRSFFSCGGVFMSEQQVSDGEFPQMWVSGWRENKVDHG